MQESCIYRVKCFCKYVLNNLLMNLIKILWIVPINNEKILFLSFDGKQFSDNPKYIYMEMKKKYPNKQYVWAFKDIDKFDYLKNEGVKLVKRNSFAFLYEFVSSKVIITNNHLPTYLPCRKKQIILNTWHGGSPLKTVGFAEANYDYYNNYFYKIQAKKYSAFLSSSKFMTEDVFGKSFKYTGTILEYGMPRNAIFFKEDKSIKEKVYKYFGIEDINIGLVLYAPTFRGDFRNSSFLPKEDMIDVEKCIEALNKRFGKEFKFLFRAHHTMKDSINADNVIIASDYPDMQELLYAVDVLITDYSSCMGDMSLTRKPVFLYTPDLEDYISDRGFYWDIYTLPFPLSKNNTDFYNSIINFDESNYRSKINDYLEKLVSFENQDSIKKTLQWIEEQW